MPFLSIPNVGRQSRLNPPNIITFVRVLIVPVVVLVLMPSFVLFGSAGEISVTRSVVAFVLFVFASVTDLFDGYVARRYGMVTALGKLLDPMADKLLVCASLIMLVPPHRVPAWMVAIVVAREIGITALRGAASTEGVVIAASPLGKAKTVLLNIGTAALILHYPSVLGLTAHTAGLWVLGAGLILTAWSGLDYLFRFAGEIYKS